MARKATEKKETEKVTEKVTEVEVKGSAAEEKETAVKAEPAAQEAPAAPAAEVVVKEQKKRGRKPGSKNAVKTINKDTEAKKGKKAEKAEKVEKQEEVYLQYAGEEIVVEEVMEKARMAYVAEGHRASSIKSLRLYIKPEERKAYYVINEKAAGSIGL